MCEENEKKIGISEFVHENLFEQVIWSSFDTDVVWVSTCFDVLMSRDKGISFTSVLSNLPYCLMRLVEAPGGKILYAISNTSIHVIDTTNPDSPTRQIFTNSGTYFENISGSILQFEAHPTEEEWAALIILSSECNRSPRSCFSTLFYTKDAGKTWDFLATYVYEFTWGRSGLYGNEKENLIVLAHTDKRIIFSSRNVRGREAHRFRSLSSFNTTRILKKCSFFVYVSGVLHLKAFVDDTSHIIKWYESHNEGESIREAKFSDDLQDNTFYILDASENATFVQIVESTKPNFGTIYASGEEKMGNYSPTIEEKENEYSQILENVVVHSSRSTFHRVLSLSGSYVATVDTEGKGGRPSSSEPKYRSMISHNFGAEWFPIPQEEECGGDDDCFVNLYSGEPQIHYIPILSQEEAVGLVVSNAHVGPYLISSPTPDQIGVYLSRDSGKTFEKISQKGHAYSMGDRGSLLLLSDIFSETMNLKFSWNQGLTTTECQFRKNGPIQIDAILSEPGNDGTRFLLFGTQDSRKGVIISVDFSEFHERTCQHSDTPGDQESDFEFYIPRTMDDHSCVLGTKRMYLRRKREAECTVNGAEFSPIISHTLCECEREDYMCEYCFETNQETKECQRSYEGECHDYKHDSPPPLCSDFFDVPTGYRKIPNDVCVSGSKYFDKEFRQVPCPKEYKEEESLPDDEKPEKSENSIFLFFYCLVLVIILLGVGFCLSREFREWICRRCCGRLGEDYEDLFGISSHRIGAERAVALLDSDSSDDEPTPQKERQDTGEEGKELEEEQEEKEEKEVSEEEKTKGNDDPLSFLEDF